MRTLAGRVTLIVTLAVAAVLVVVGAVVITEVGRRERATFNRELRAAADRAEPPARRALLLAGTPNRALERAVGQFSVRLTRRGAVVYDDLGAPGVPIPSRNGASTVRSGAGERWRVVVRVVRPRRDGRLVVAGSLTAVEDRIADTRRTLALAFVLALAACALAVRFLTARTLLPLRRLREGAAAVSSTRDLTTRIPAAGVAEVDAVAESINAMLARLEASAAAGERFTADAGHELRTPLTSLRANLAALRTTLNHPQGGLRSALDNLLENAARHGARTVRVTVEPDGVLVDDDGPGIPPEDRERVFERFTRGRAAAAPGSGLGLAIVAQQAALHGGHAEVGDSPLGGARVVLKLPNTDRVR